ncbi:hypothetical protein XAP412_970068 [Xanthomonas phaseoli pv. phaseoli]|uniref:Transposase n=1 Tax=Xanthomonas campestris pv. phaseoli TaxID=317013 RepID=A0AB38E6Y1_XANCH|nr:hypothetical protein XAP6984_1000067 [Xanthomonas phaseoli pv. phaseoli]SON92013.1 hypothetical protein XAP412_970068 [Xanthomonas phaseoli pv. phaseoli]SON93263.1 hypothetical protein XAP7430_990068 [Xanthomonas phaseoli pv. phaseoli]SOO30327.1 hypothetical protein XAP6164_4240023 [Xanthomonas phaseoli pv. phaseoli]
MRRGFVLVNRTPFQARRTFGPEPPGRPFSAWVDDGPTQTAIPKGKNLRGKNHQNLPVRQAHRHS